MLCYQKVNYDVDGGEDRTPVDKGKKIKNYPEPSTLIRRVKGRTKNDGRKQMVITP